MAWKAKLTVPIFQSGDRVFATFDFYDDVDSIVRHSEQFAFGPAWSNADMQSAVQQRGRQVRDAFTRAAALAATFPENTTILSIP